MPTRTDALVSQQETGKITASIIPVVSGCHPALVFSTILGCNRSSGAEPACMGISNMMHAQRSAVFGSRHVFQHLVYAWSTH
jgi:hypothetical protein